MTLEETIDWEKTGGLVPAIIQDADNRQVLMLGYMNRDALAATLASGRVTFWSRTREKLWVKGETSGNSLALKTIALDCDRDTLLVQAEPQGPVCHLGTPSCFDSEPFRLCAEENPSLDFLAQLERLLAQRKEASPESSYTASLYARGTKRMAQKVGEEGVEVALAAVAGDRDELIDESSDLLYHLLVLLQDQGLALKDITARLQHRHRQP